MNDTDQERTLEGLRVLVVEDQAPIALQLEDLLAESKCEIIGPASRIPQALRLVDDEDIDVAVLDLNIAGDLVYPVAEALEKKGLPYFFATAYGLASLDAPYRTKRVLEKPFSRRAFLRALQETLSP